MRSSPIVAGVGLALVFCQRDFASRGITTTPTSLSRHMIRLVFPGRSALLIALLIATGILLGSSSTVLASALATAHCAVTAEVVDSGAEIRQAHGPSGEAREHRSTYLRLKVLGVQRAGIVDNCDFLEVGDIFKVTGGSNPDPLKNGDRIEAGVTVGSTMTPAGVASAFLRWGPISTSRPLPPVFHLESSDTPDASFKKP